MATAAQIAANRANARRSTGPRTGEGKAASSRNALTHGAHASDDTILATAPDTYLDDFRAHFQPVGVLEAHLVDHLAVLASRRERLNAALDALLELNERHALTEHLHERYGINTPTGEALGQPSWQAALRRYDGNPGADPRRPGLDSDPALDPDPILCSLAYTLSGPRAAALFRHEASVDRRFSATLKQLMTLQAQRRAAVVPTGSTPPASYLHEPSLQRALDRYLRATATPGDPFYDLPTPAPTSTRPTAADSTPALSSDDQAYLPDQSQSSQPAHPSSTLAPSEPGTPGGKNEPNPPATTPATIGSNTNPASLHPHPAAVDMVPAIRPQPEAVSTPTRPNQPDRRIEPSTYFYLPENEPTTFLSVLPRHPDEPSSIPAHWTEAML